NAIAIVESIADCCDYFAVITKCRVETAVRLIAHQSKIVLVVRYGGNSSDNQHAIRLNQKAVSEIKQIADRRDYCAIASKVCIKAAIRVVARKGEGIIRAPNSDELAIRLLRNAGYIIRRAKKRKHSARISKSGIESHFLFIGDKVPHSRASCQPIAIAVE